LLFSIIAVIIFSIGVILWFFLYSSPSVTPSLGTASDPLSLQPPPRRFQFLNKDVDGTPTGTTTTEVTPYTLEVLTKIWKAPTTGQTFIAVSMLEQITSTTTVGTTTVETQRFVYATGTVLMFADRTTGHIYGYNRQRNKTYQISNTTIPGIHDAYIFNNGKSVVFRYTDEEKGAIVGVLATIPSVPDTAQAEPLLNITYLPSEVTSVAINKKTNLLSYLVSNDEGASVYTIQDNKRAVLVGSSPFKQWALSYGGNSLYATSKPSAYIPGQTVLLPAFSFVLGDKTGLMSTPGENGQLLSSMWTSVGLKTFFSKNGDNTVLSISTVASKCVWGNSEIAFCAVPKSLPRGSEGLPDDWFQGRISFSDTLVSVDSKSNTVLPLYSLDTTEKIPFDVVSLTPSLDDTMFGFVRKQDGSLWLLDLNILF